VAAKERHLEVRGQPGCEATSRGSPQKESPASISWWRVGAAWGESVMAKKGPALAVYE